LGSQKSAIYKLKLKQSYPAEIPKQVSKKENNPLYTQSAVWDNSSQFLKLSWQDELTNANLQKNTNVEQRELEEPLKHNQLTVESF